ncbi:MAG TPA: S8 family serine peptidase [Thermoanaerobaculia bacterium]|nr:S8 family serine peptidase [Thermoanaerobaculia bacterium]
MKTGNRLLILALIFTLAASLAAAPKAKKGFVKVLVQHGTSTSAPDQLLVGIAGEVVQRYESYTVVQIEQKELKAFAERAELQGVEIQTADHFDQIYLPSAVADARLGTRGSHPARALAEGLPPGRDRLYVVQFVGPILPEWQDAVKNAGAKVFTYVQFNSLIVAASGDTATTIAALPYVQYLDAFQSFTKDQKTKKKHGEVREYVIHLADVPGVEHDLRTIANWGSSVGEPRRGIENELRVSVRLDGGRIDQVLDLPLVVGISSPIRASFSDERVAAATAGLIMPESGQPRSNPHYKDWLSSVCSYCSNLQSEGFYVGIADTGLNGGSGSGADHHPDIPAWRINWGSNFNSSANWYYSPTLADVLGHGSAVAGVIGGNPSSTTGQTDEGGFFYGTGIAPSSGIFVTAIDVSFDGLTPVADSVGDATANGVWVQNHSYNRYTHPSDAGTCAEFFDGLYEAMSQEFDQAVIDHGVTITTSAGNRDQQPEHPSGCGSPYIIGPLTLPPATAKNVISMGGSENVRGDGDPPWPSCHNSLSTDFCDIMENSKRSTRYNGWASFSLKWYIKPDLFAPASRVAVHQSTERTTTPNFCSPGGAAPLGTDDLYIGGTGTSFAAPVAAGAAILASRRYAETVKVNNLPVPGAAKPSLVKAMLIAGARSMYRSPSDGIGYDNPGNQAHDPAPNSRQGFGRLSLDQVVSQYPARVYINESASLSSVSSSWSQTYKVHDPNLPVKVVIAWTDPAGMPTSDQGTPVINDLDLIVEIGSPCSYRHLGNALHWEDDAHEEVSDWDPCTSSSVDHANNVEMVKFYPGTFNPITQFTVTVRATTGMMSSGNPQKFSAVIYNAGGLNDTLPPVTPASLTATAVLSGTWSANLTWPSVSGATSYEIYASSGGANFTSVGTRTTNSFTHNGLAASTTYLYKVRAVNSTGKSDFTVLDPATTVLFTDGDLTGAAIKAAHVSELRTAANAFRAAASLPAYSFTDSTITAGTTLIKAAHMSDVQVAIDIARDALGLPLDWDSVNPSVGSLIYRGDVNSLRDLVK